MRRRKIVLTRGDEEHTFNNLSEAGDFVGVSRERIRQILSEKNKIHKKTGYVISYGGYLPRGADETEFERFYKKACDDNRIIYKDKLFKYYKKGIFVARDSSYIRLIKGRETIRYRKPSFEAKARIGSEYTFRVVAKLFVPNYGDFKEVRHVNGIKKGHGADNLIWHWKKEN